MKITNNKEYELICDIKDLTKPKKEKTSKVDIQDKSHNVVKNTQTVVKEVKQQEENQ